MKTRYLLAALTSVAFACAAQQPNEGPQTSAETGQMQTQMQEMRALMERIRNTTDPAERQRLMAEHMQAMHDGMTMMGRMMGGGMMGRQGGGAGAGPPCAQNDPECRMRQMQGEQGMMGERMGMMQMMMQQMMDHMMAQGPEGQPGETRRERRQDRSERQTQEQDQGHEAHH
jgi:hypothetical protein